MINFFTGLGAGIVGILLLVAIARWIMKAEFVPDNLYEWTIKVVRPILHQQPLIVIFEETIFRWGLLNHLRVNPDIGLLNAYIISSVVFGFAHIFNFGYRFGIIATLAGFVYGSSYILSNFNIFVPMIIHAMTNVIWQGYFDPKRHKACNKTVTHD